MTRKNVVLAFKVNLEMMELCCMYGNVEASTSEGETESVKALLGSRRTDVQRCTVREDNQLQLGLNNVP